jgi:hypothetical protein
MAKTTTKSSKGRSTDRSKRAASRGAGAKTGRARATKDPKGGLTAAGRREFERKQGSQLKPGVKKPGREMTREEMRRKGSWASRFYGRKKLLPLVDENGKPTRFALTAAAWGEPVPKTEAAARRIAAKGKKLLEKYREQGESKS